jgi:hypothetical protein
MRTLGRRLEKLESLLGQGETPRWTARLVLRSMGRTLDLEQSRCTRTLSSDGCLAELVDLNGDEPMPSEEELDRFVAQFPIVRSTEVAAVGGAQVSPGLPR